MLKLYAVSIVLGLICSFGFPPFGYALAAICSLSLFFYLLDTIKTNRQIILFSFSFGYGYCLYSHHWLSDSLLAYGDRLLWLYPIGIAFVPAFFALYFALAGYLIRKFANKNIFNIAVICLSVEFLRSYAYIESPWLLIGYLWAGNPYISQIAAVVAIWGISFLTIIWAASIYGAINILMKKASYKEYLSYIIIALISFALCQVYGENRLNHPPKTIEQNAKVRVIQANIDQNISSRMRNYHLNFMKHLNLSKKNNEQIDYIIWPEGAHEYDLEPEVLNALKTAIPENALLILNATRREYEPYKHWNSMFAVNNHGEIYDYYDKIHLVALGEFIPFRSILPFINKITPGGIDFARGNKLKTFKARHPFMPSICYEAAFPDRSPEFFTWILNITNDGWFGKSIGPYQHLAIAKFRTIEQGVPMVRASLTGISAIIDSFGFIQESLPLLTEGVLDGNLPGYISNFTPFHNYGYLCIIALLLIIYLAEKTTIYILKLITLKNQD